MRFINPIFFITDKKSISDRGDIVKNPNDRVERRVLANKVSVGQKEFYEAQAKGFKPELKFEVRDFEYMGEAVLKYNNVEYDIIRTFKNEKRCVFELTCSRTIMRKA